MPKSASTPRTRSGRTKRPATIAPVITYGPIPNEGGIVLLWGYGLKLRIDRNHLCAEDGIGHERRSARFAKAPARLRRVVLLSTNGYISLEVLRWLHGARASLVAISPDGNVLAAWGPQRLDDARLRRAQALAPWTNAGLAIARYLLTQKVAGQKSVLSAYGLGTDEHIAFLAEIERSMDEASSVEALCLCEAEAAAAYFDALSAVSVGFVKNDEPAVPAHWRTVDARSSLITGRARRASNPGQAVLNYLYAILEAETSIALQAYNLDRGLGIVHTDQPARANFSLDVMEGARPLADRIALDLVRSRTFRAKDFVETYEGGCRLAPSLARELASLMLRVGRSVAPTIERVVRILETTPLEPGRPLVRVSRAKTRPLPTFLTESRRSQGRATLQRDRERKTLRPRCAGCGGATPPGRTLCDPCSIKSKADWIPRFAQAGPAALARARASESKEADRKRGRAIGAQLRANAEWTPSPEDDVLDYARDVLPVIAIVPLRTLRAASGLSLRTLSLARRGQPPHRRHWQALLEASKEFQARR